MLGKLRVVLLVLIFTGGMFLFALAQAAQPDITISPSAISTNATAPIYVTLKGRGLPEGLGAEDISFSESGKGSIRVTSVERKRGEYKLNCALAMFVRPGRYPLFIRGKATTAFLSVVEVKLSGSEKDPDAPIVSAPISGSSGELYIPSRGKFFIHVSPSDVPVNVLLAAEPNDKNGNNETGSIRIEKGKVLVTGTRKVVFEPLKRSGAKNDVRVVATLEDMGTPCAERFLTVFEFTVQLEHMNSELSPSKLFFEYIGEKDDPSLKVLLPGAKVEGMKVLGVKERMFLPAIENLESGGVTAAAAYNRRGTLAVLSETPKEDFSIVPGKAPDEKVVLTDPVETSARIMGSSITIGTIPENSFEGNVKAIIILKEEVEGDMRVWADTTDIPKGSKTATARSTVNTASVATSGAAKILSVGGMIIGPAITVTSSSIKALMGGDVYAKAEAEAYIDVKGTKGADITNRSFPGFTSDVRDTPSRLHSALEISPRSLGGFDVPFVKVPGLETDEKSERIEWTLRFTIGSAAGEEGASMHVGGFFPTRLLLYSGLWVSAVRGNNQCEARAFLRTKSWDTRLLVYNWE
ncbi:MAG: hypothetical protein PHE61_03200 [Candidatus Omnitrophica bacterium]|nr:hypothetical protein [Candidatus Omnitrophota bacterium]